MLLCCVWYFDFAFFNMTVVKNLMKKIPFYDVFSKCVCSLSTSQFFLFRKLYFTYSRGKQFLILTIAWHLVYWKGVSVGAKHMIFRIETLFNLIYF